MRMSDAKAGTVAIGEVLQTTVKRNVKQTPGGHGGSIQQCQHMSQLDGLVAFAVAAVAWYHWMPLRSYGVPWGPLGVQLFFVLSGFLITGILFDARFHAENGQETWF